MWKQRVYACTMCGHILDDVNNGLKVEDVVADVEGKGLVDEVGVTHHLKHRQQ